MDKKHDQLTLPARSHAENSRRVVDYFDGIRFDVSLFWTDSTTLGIHFGYWDSNTRSHHEALRNTNRVLADRARLRRGQHVLDAGWGLAAPPARLLNWLGLMSTVRVRNAESCYMLRELVDRGLGIYGLLSACK